jgi:hypothetical protein
MSDKLIFVAVIAGCALLAAQAKADDKFDLAIEAIIASDGMDTGLTYTDHKPNFEISLTPSYGIYYATLFAENVDYGPDNETDGLVKLSAGATPEFGNLAVDFNLQRRWKPGEADHASSRWLPYVTATYTFNDQLNTSYGVGYYAYDRSDLSKSFWELYTAVDATPFEGLTLHAEASYDPNSDFDHTDYLEIIGSATITLPHNFELVGKIGYEDYLQKQLPSYTWAEAQINYNFNDHMTFGVRAHGNSLSSVQCPDQAYTDCDNSVFATLILRGKLSDLSK